MLNNLYEPLAYLEYVYVCVCRDTRIRSLKSALFKMRDRNLVKPEIPNRTMKNCKKIILLAYDTAATPHSK